MIEVLFAIPELDRGGPDRVFHEILTRIDRGRFRPSLMVGSPRGHYLSTLPTDVAVEVLGRGDRTLRGRYPVGRALRHVRRRCPDIVLATQRMILTLAPFIALLPRRTKLVFRQANDVSADFAELVRQSVVKHQLARRLVLAGLRRADAVICQSEAMRRDLAELLGDDSKLHVISNPIDPERVAAQSAPAVKLRGSPALVSVGRLAPQKGFDILLPAIAEVRTRYPDLHLTILGDGPDRGPLEVLARRLGLGETVTFTGFVAEPLPHVRAADLFVLASRYEGFPNAALEALACGTPVVLTDCPGANAEIVHPGRNGRLAANAASGAMAATLATAIEELPRYVRSDIQSDCEARFSSAGIVGAYEQLLASLVHDRPRARGAA